MKKLFIFMVLISTIVACNDDNESTLIKFEGITETNENGESTGSVDKSDWNLNDIWIDKEESIFDYVTYEDTKNNKSGSEYSCAFAPAYPNPCSDVFNLHFSFTKGCILKIALVDQNLNIKSYVEINDLSTNSLTYNISMLSLANNNIYRFYYKFEHADGTIQKGHGDIKVSN